MLSRFLARMSCVLIVVCLIGYCYSDRKANRPQPEARTKALESDLIDTAIMQDYLTTISAEIAHGKLTLLEAANQFEIRMQDSEQFRSTMQKIFPCSTLKESAALQLFVRVHLYLSNMTHSATSESVWNRLCRDYYMEFGASPYDRVKLALITQVEGLTDPAETTAFRNRNRDTNPKLLHKDKPEVQPMWSKT